MNPRPIILAGILLLGLLAEIGPTQATTTLQAPSSIPNVGKFPDIDVNGSIVAIAHLTNTNSIVLTFSTNGGTSWVDRATGVSVFSNASGIKVWAFDNLTFTILYFGPSASCGSQRLTAIRTNDGGFSWSSPILLPQNPSCSSSWNSEDEISAVKFTDGSIATTLLMSQVVGCGGTCGYLNVINSTDQGLTWTISSNIASCTGSACWASVLTTALNGTSGGQYDAYVGNIRYQIRAGTPGTGTTVNDAFTPLTLDGTLYISPDGTAAGVRTSGGYLAWVRQVGSTTFQLFNTTLASTNEYKPFLNSGRGGFITSINAANSVVMQTSCNIGAASPSWGTTIILGTGTASSHPRIYSNTTAVQGAFSNGTTLGYFTNDDTTCPTSGALNNLVSGAASITIPGLQMFDVDPTGAAVLIARRDNGTNVSTYAPQTLTQYAIENVGCTNGGSDAGTTVGAVDATAYNSNGYVAYNACGTVGGGGTSDVDELRIRSNTLGTPSLGGCAYCRATVSEADDVAFFNNINLPDNFHELGYIEQYPYTFSDVGSQATTVAFPFTEQGTGRFGIYAVKFDDNDIDSDATTRVQFSATSTTINALCSWRDSATGSDYLAVSELSTGLKVYEFSINTAPDPPVVSISARPSTPSAFQQPTSISCAGNMIMARLAGGLVGAFYVDADAANSISAGQIAWGPTATISPGIAMYHGGVALSPGARIGAYQDGTTIRVINATTGNIIANITRTDGDLYGMAIDRPANSLWTATGYPIGTLTRYSIFQQTNGGSEVIDTNPSPSGTGTTSTTTSTPGPSSNPELTGALEDLVGVEGSGSIMLAILYILMFAAGAYGIFGGSPLGIGIGAILGFIFSVFAGLIPQILVFLMVLVAAALVGFRVFGGSSQSEGM